MEIAAIHKTFLQCSSVSIDTRKIQSDCLFVAIKGERFDANTFAAEALEKGAAFVIIDNPDFFIDERTILVDDSLRTLQQLSKYHRNYLKLPIIALTGSNGKTTTKELIQMVLSQKFNCKATVGNLNNHIGVPLTLLSFDDSTEIGIVEMGANHQKEIEFLCVLATPDYGYITNFGKAHLEGFGGVEGVIRGKSEMYDYLRANQKMVFVNLEDPIQVEKSAGIKSFTFGAAKDADLNIQAVEASPFVSISFSQTVANSNLIGLYNANNINAAIAMGTYFKVEDNQIKKAIESYIPENNRSQLLIKNGVEIILDAYNANPSSMNAALENFRQLQKERKLAILGDMFEMGSESFKEHQGIVETAQKDNTTRFLFIGKDFYANRLEHTNYHFFETFDDFSDYLIKNPPNEKMILIKGSRGMALERTLDIL